MSYLEMENVHLGFGPAGSRTEVLSDVNLSVGENEFVAVIGFSGSGKSTLIALLGGLLRPDRGEIRLSGRAITAPGPHLGVVFQNYSLLPWLTVYQNIELATRRAFPKHTKGERRKHVEQYIDLVGLTPATQQRPHELSGGMRQRVSLARTLSMQPKILLMDEPLSALDALTRAVLQDEILSLWSRAKRTVVMITNDVDEAVLMADRIIPLTIGPNATLAKDYPVHLQRPRDRTTLNENREFKHLKGSITEFMVDIRKARKAVAKTRHSKPPAITPIHSSVA